MMGLDTPETCRSWRNILRISCASSWFFFTQYKSLYAFQYTRTPGQNKLHFMFPFLDCPCYCMSNCFLNLALLSSYNLFVNWPKKLRSTKLCFRNASTAKQSFVFTYISVNLSKNYYPPLNSKVAETQFRKKSHIARIQFLNSPNLTGQNKSQNGSLWINFE